MKHRICRIVLALSLAHSLWSQTMPTCSEENPPDEAVLETRVRPVSWKQLVPNIAKDQKQIWTFPLRIGQGNNWAPALAVSAITAGLVIADPHDTRISGGPLPLTGSTPQSAQIQPRSARPSFRSPFISPA